MIEWSGEYYLLATEAYKYKLDNRTERKLTTRSSECGGVIFISHIFCFSTLCFPSLQLVCLRLLLSLAVRLLGLEQEAVL